MLEQEQDVGDEVGLAGGAEALLEDEGFVVRDEPEVTDPDLDHLSRIAQVLDPLGWMGWPEAGKH
jgi:hypothetical protein